jgi:hypothetical protein
VSGEDGKSALPEETVVDAVVDVLDPNWKTLHYGADPGAALESAIGASVGDALRGMDALATFVISGSCSATAVRRVSPFVEDVVARPLECSAWLELAEPGLVPVLLSATVFLPDPNRSASELESAQFWLLPFVEGHGDVSLAVPNLNPGVQAAIDFSYLKCGRLARGLARVPWHPERHMNEPPLPTPTPYELEADAASYGDAVLRASQGAVAGRSSNMWANALTASQTVGYRILQRMGWDGGRIGLRSYNRHSDFGGAVDAGPASLAPVAADMMMEAVRNGTHPDNRSRYGGPQRPGGLGFNGSADDAELRNSDVASGGEVSMSKAAIKRVQKAQRGSKGGDVPMEFKEKQLSFVSKKELHELLLDFIEQQATGADGAERADMVFPPTLSNPQVRYASVL